MRNMSFAMTTGQIRDRSKTVTRRFGWNFLKPGDRVCAVEQGMGLKKGEKVNRLAVIEIVNTRWEPLIAISANDCALEGFPKLSPYLFVRMICEHYKIKDLFKPINRIEFKYVDDEYVCCVCEKPVPDYEPVMCCSGWECGCQGEPQEPCICSKECEKKVMGIQTIQYPEVNHE